VLSRRNEKESRSARGAGGRFELSDVTIQCQIEYATINVVGLDEMPIANQQNITFDNNSIS
jgi:hypothetical protein